MALKFSDDGELAMDAGRTISGKGKILETDVSVDHSLVRILLKLRI